VENISKIGLMQSFSQSKLLLGILAPPILGELHIGN
jgi:hypothetical protein